MPKTFVPNLVNKVVTIFQEALNEHQQGNIENVDPNIIHFGSGLHVPKLERSGPESYQHLESKDFEPGQPKLPEFKPCESDEHILLEMADFIDAETNDRLSPLPILPVISFQKSPSQNRQENLRNSPLMRSAWGRVSPKSPLYQDIVQSTTSIMNQLQQAPVSRGRSHSCDYLMSAEDFSEEYPPGTIFKTSKKQVQSLKQKNKPVDLMATTFSVMNSFKPLSFDGQATSLRDSPIMRGDAGNYNNPQPADGNEVETIRPCMVRNDSIYMLLSHSDFEDEQPGSEIPPPMRTASGSA